MPGRRGRPKRRLPKIFLRDAAEPQTVADLTSETFLEAVESFHPFDARKGSPRAWLFGIARHVYARHCAATANSRQAGVRLAAQLTLDDDEIQQLAAKIDDQRAGRRLLEPVRGCGRSTVPRSNSSTSPGSRS